MTSGKGKAGGRKGWNRHVRVRARAGGMQGVEWTCRERKWAWAGGRKRWNEREDGKDVETT